MTYPLYARCNIWDIKVVKEWDRLGIFSDNELRGLGKIRKTSEGTFYVYVDAFLEFGGIDEFLTKTKSKNLSQKQREYNVL